MSEIPPAGENPIEPPITTPATPEPPTAEHEPFDYFQNRPVGAGGMPPQPPPGVGYSPAPGGGRIRGLLAARATGWVVAAVLAGAVIGLAVADATTSSSRPALAGPIGRSTTLPAGGAGGFGGAARSHGLNGNGSSSGGNRPFFGNGATNATFGTVKSVASGSFVMTTSTGTTVTVKETSSTTYRSGSNSSASAKSIASGDRVVVSGSKSGSTISATQVAVIPSGGFGGFGGPAAS